MPWLLLLLAIVAFVVALKTTSMLLLVACLLVALGGMVGWIVGLLSQRVGNSAREPSAVLLDPQELQRLREQARARGTADAGPSAP